MGDDQGGAVGHGALERGLHHALALCVQGAGGFIEQQQRWVFQDGAGDGQALALTPRQAHTAFAQKAVIALGQLGQKFVRIGRLGGGDDLGVAGLGSAVADVVPRRARKNHRLLRHDANACAQVVQAHAVDGHAINLDLPLLRVVKAQQQIEQRGFACATGPDHRHGLSAVDLGVELVNRRCQGARGVMKAHTLQGQGGPGLGPGGVLRLGRGGHRRLGVEQLHQTLGGARSAQQVAIHLAQHRKGTGQQDHIHNDLAQLTRAQAARIHRQGALVQAPQQGCAAGQNDETHQQGAGAHPAHGRGEGVQSRGLVAARFAPFSAMALHHGDGVEHLGRHGAGVGHPVLAGTRQAPHPAAKPHTGQHNQHQHRDDLNHQPRPHPHQHEQSARSHHRIAQTHGQR